jgi:phosphoglycerate dehydrogenase-like enzyme
MAALSAVADGRLRIVVLDGYTANPGDLTWDAFAEFGDLTVHDRTPPDEIVKRAKDAEVVLTNKALLDAKAIAALPNLRFIGVLATGFNVVDVEAGSIPRAFLCATSRSTARRTWRRRCLPSCSS